MQKMRKIRLGIVDDHPVVIEGLRKIILEHFDVDDVMEFHTGHAFVLYAQQSKLNFDVVLVDITLPDISGVDLCRKIKLASPDTQVLGFSNHNDRALVMQMLSSGASGYILKNASSTEIINCLEETLAGHLAFSEEIKTIIAKPSASDFKSIPPLTKREKQILQLIAEGRTSAAIAEELQVSPFTIETHRRNLMQKFDAKNVAHLLKIAGQLKFI